eukprot:CAMPEP_0197844164 /NCGR_PEP_ID=MMETSP1438-20131217/1145_1 /TAXON_ID=1461541 /ORGANISM="Pterosperma sp., Strain CCMP1384" /LENGTH=325 /DNA_ID=CAMNT_0043454801 /DNA_START=800 /DNA_END=1777 /DNA_ORIENTATION=+
MELIRKRARDARWPPVAIFPEGTTTNGKCLISFKLGAFAPMVPIQPVVFKFSWSKLDPSWSSIGPSSLMLAARLMLQLHNSLSTEYLPVMAPDEADHGDPARFAARVKSAMADALGIPCTEHNLGEGSLLELARKYQIPPEYAVCELGGAMNELFPNPQSAIKYCKSYIHKFAVLDRRRKGWVSVDEVAQVLGVVSSRACVKEVLRMCDVDSCNRIEMRQFMIAMASLRKLVEKRPDLLRTAFEACGGDRDQRLRLNEVQRAVSHCIPDLDLALVANQFTKADANSDGVVTFEEFQSYVAENPEMLPILSSLPPFNYSIMVNGFV